MRYAMVNDHGLNEGVVEMDDPSAASHPMPRGWKLMPVTLEEHTALRHLGHAARHDPDRGWHLLPDGHVQKWTRARGHRWFTVMIEQERHRGIVGTLRNARMLDCLADIPDDQIPAPPRCVRHFPVPTIEIQPGLIIREQTDDEAVALASEVIASGMFDEHEDLGRLRTAVWHDDPFSWPIAVVWQGQVLGYETYHFLESRPEIVRVGFNVRLRRDRPYQFWRRVFKPFFEHLKSLGITTIESRVRADRPQYIDGLVDAYGAERVNGDAFGVNLRYSVDQAVGLAQPRPAKSTAGPQWSWSESPVTVREAADEDMAVLRLQIDDAFRFAPGRARAKQILEDWTALDGATVVLGLLNGTIRYARSVRRRVGTTAAWASLLPFYDEPDQAVAARGFAAWGRAVGYVKGTTFVPHSQYQNPIIQAHLARQAHRVVRVVPGTEPLHELEFDF